MSVNRESIRRIESSPVFLEYTFKINHKETKTPSMVKPYERSSLSQEQLPKTVPALKSLVKNPALLNILMNRPRVLGMVSRHPKLLSLIISHPKFATILESRPSLIGLAINNPKILYTLASRPDLLSLVSENPKLLAFLKSNPSSLDSLMTKPALLALLAKSSGLLDKVIKDSTLLSEKNNEIKKINEATTKFNAMLRVQEDKAKTISLKSYASVFAQRLKMVLQKIILTIRKILIPFQMRIITTEKPRFLKLLSTINKLSLSTIETIKQALLNPALLAQLGGIAVTANKGKVIPTSGSIQEGETQTETQLKTQEEIGPVHEVEGASEITLLKETIG